MIYQLFVKHTLLFILGARLFLYLLDVLGAQYMHAQERVPNF